MSHLFSSSIAKVSIVIPTYNAGPLFADVLSMIFKQSLMPFEVLVIDSSSTDGTRELAHRFPTTLVKKIPKIEFGHGKTRNLGAHIARGEFVVFVTQDAVPANSQWLQRLIESFADQRVAGAFSRQIARNQAVPMEKFFYSKMYSARSKTFNNADAQNQEILFSDASSAIRRSFILEHPFAEDILMSEDYEWALRILQQGSYIRYAAESEVIHSHDTSPVLLFKRYFDFGVSHMEIRAKGVIAPKLGKGLRSVIDEFSLLAKEGNILWIPRSVIYNGAKFLGLTFGRLHPALPRGLKRRFTSYYAEYWQ